MENIISCPAKLNLSLNINNFRSDGFHEIQSIFAKINLYDELIVEKNSQFQLSIQGIFSKKLDKGHNIINKIYNYFEQNFDLKSSVKVTLKKNIPIGAGLGGGSSDGASFIKILNKIFDLKLSKIEMQKISINFGSDLPFFFEDDICLVEGRGESITSLNNKENNQSESLVNFLNNYKTLLIFPQIHISTIDVYKELINRVKNSLQKYSLKYDQNYLTNNRVIDIILNARISI